MSGYKICKHCGEYEHDCRCSGAREVRKIKLNLQTLIAEIEGAYVGLMSHPEEPNTTGFQISKASKEKLIALKQIAERYKE